MLNFIFTVILMTICSGYCAAQELTPLSDHDFANGVTVDLREPLYEDGVLSTQRGGVIIAPQLRLQALKMSYTRQLKDNVPILTVVAEDQLIIEFGEYTFTGKKLFYDFQKREGVIYDGRTSAEPWFFGGEKLELRSDGSYLIYNGYFTTSEKDQPDWGIYSSNILVEEEKFLTATHIKMRIYRYPVLWIPSLRMNLDTIFESPIRYRFKWGGRQGPRFGLSYQIFSWSRWKTFLRFDYRITRGPGGGLEFFYLSDDHKTEFESINYVSKDSSLIHLHEKMRYRFKGYFQKAWDNDKTTLLLTYDKLSDIDMPQSYDDRDFDFESPERTRLLIRHQEENQISTFYSRVRINSFQTVKQELPTFSTNFKPFSLAHTGIIFENSASASFLDYKYSDNFIHSRDYSSTRFEYQPSLYKPFFVHPVTITPKIGAVGIIYGDSPSGESQWLALGVAGLQVNTRLYRYFDQRKHIIEPYINYDYYSAPTSSPHQHYIFDISDGWTRLNRLTFGVKNGIYSKENGCIHRLFYAHVFAHTFFDYHGSAMTIPKIYGRFSYLADPKIKYTLDAAWDFAHNQIDHFNLRSDWTINSDFAISWEYRHRGAWSWRKVDENSFFLEAFHKNKSLHHSTLSDRRDTILTHFFYRFRPNWACEFVSRQGWNRKKEPKYFEFEINLFTTIQTAWHLQLSYQHQENEDRLAIYMNVGLKRPDVTICEKNICRFD